MKVDWQIFCLNVKTKKPGFVGGNDLTGIQEFEEYLGLVVIEILVLKFFPFWLVSFLFRWLVGR